MINFKPTGALTGAGVLSAISASLCCITPVVSLLAGSSSIAANFSWIEPARPYLIGLSITALAFAWYLKFKPQKKNNADCDCETPKQLSFFQSTIFLGIVTVFTLLMMAFPLYAKVFYSAPHKKAAVVAADNKQQVRFTIDGMTCAACAAHVDNELSKLKGVTGYTTSYTDKSSIITFNPSNVDVKTIETAIHKTGYTVKGYALINSRSTMQESPKK